MTHDELKQRIAQVTDKSNSYETTTCVFEDGAWGTRDCCAFTQNKYVDVRIKPPGKGAPVAVTQEELETYIEFLSELHPDYRTMFNHECPTAANAEISLCFNHSMLNYQMQVLWRYTWCAPWQVLFINYLFENGFTPAECLLITGIKTPWGPVKSTPYHIINKDCLISPDLVLPLLESLGEVAPDSYTINSKFIHDADNEWIKSAPTHEEKNKRVEGMKLKNFEKKGLLTRDTFIEDLGNIENIRTWIAQFN